MLGRKRYALSHARYRKQKQKQKLVEESESDDDEMLNGDDWKIQQEEILLATTNDVDHHLARLRNSVTATATATATGTTGTATASMSSSSSISISKKTTNWKSKKNQQQQHITSVSTRTTTTRIATTTTSTTKNNTTKTTKTTSKKFCVRIDSHLLGPPRMSLPWIKRREMFRQLGKLDHLTTLIVHGTVMGQVISGEMLSMALKGPSLKIVRIENGLIFDSHSSVREIADALMRPTTRRRKLRRFVEISFCNFLNNVTPTEDTDSSLLDPLFHALSSLPKTIQTIEVSSSASFIPWERSLVSKSLLGQFLTSQPQIEYINFSNLGFQDDDLTTIIDSSCLYPLQSLHSLVLNANNNTQYGLQKMIQGSFIWNNLKRLELCNSINMSSDTFAILCRRLREFNCNLQSFTCTLPSTPYGTRLYYQRTIDMYLQMHRLPMLHQRYYSTFAKPKDCIEVLSECKENLNLLFLLLQQRPTICNILKSSSSSSSSSSSRGGTDSNHDDRHNDDVVVVDNDNETNVEMYINNNDSHHIISRSNTTSHRHHHHHQQQQLLTPKVAVIK